MSARTLILSTFVTLILTATSSAIQPMLTPQTGVLVLRNGQVLHGDITRAGDYYVVTLGSASEIRLKADEVEVACRNLDEAYLHRLQRLDPTSQNERISLADWCLRNRLLDQAEEQLNLVAERAPDLPQVKSLRQRLVFAREPKPELSSTKSQVNIATIGSEQLDKTLRQLPDGSIEKFAAVVQPILLNRCGANQCHGPNSKSEYQLLKPALGQVANQRYSQRNLYSTLRFVDHKDPPGSPLLFMPQRRHGGSASAVFDERTRGQLDVLAGWVAHATATHEVASTPQKIDPKSSLLSSSHHPQTKGQAAEPGKQAVVHPDNGIGTDPASAEKPASSVTSPQPSSSVGMPFAPRDAFDPEIFNRRFFPGK
jgi:hypothetical protein